MLRRNGKEAGFPYSLSRWTDIPCAKWPWMVQSFRQGSMVAFDPTLALPAHWSLHPEETLGLVFWTKNPTNIIQDRSMLAGHRVKVHITATGWEEVEKGAPTLEESGVLIAKAVDTFGAENVTWRFSPVPLVADVVSRFSRIAHQASQAGLKSVYLSFLQTNDLMPETRTEEERLTLLDEMAAVGNSKGIKLLLCNEDRLLAGRSGLHPNLNSGICAPPEDFALEGQGMPPSEGCGCVLMVDPFTINESCTLGCTYCYASDKSLATKKRNTTKYLNVLR